MTPTNAIGLVRLSDLRDEDLDGDGVSASLEDQRQRLQRRAEDLGWVIGRFIVENDHAPGNGKARNASAFKRRKVQLPDGRVGLRTVRPGFRLALDLLARGEHDGLIALDLDRVCRDPRDLEDLIEVVELRSPRLSVESVTGSLRLATDADLTMARVMVAMANKSSRDTARRVRDSRERKARSGEFGGGVRRFGFEADGVTVRPDEAAVVADCAARLLQGVPLKALAAELRKRGVPSVTGAAWTSTTLRDILRRERNAGRMVLHGEVVGAAPWQPIVAPDVHDRVVRLLDSRSGGPGNAPVWLGSGLYRCGVCEPEVVTVSRGKAGGQAVYKCSKRAHLGRAAKYVDQYVEQVAVHRLARADVADLLAPARADVDTAALTAEADALKAKKASLARLLMEEVLDEGQVRAESRRIAARLAEIDALTADVPVVDSPLAEFADVASVEEAQEVWDRLPLANRRLVVAALMVVTILPAGRRGGPGFDRSTVRIEPRKRP